MNKFFVVFVLFLTLGFSYQFTIKIAKLKYDGGGDWYANRTALSNLAIFCNSVLYTSINPADEVVEVGSKEIFNYPYVYMTGHGNVIFSPSDAENLRSYLMAGGFLHIDDNYGLDKFVRIEMKKVFPELEFIELPFDHPIYNQKYKFSKGLPKVHEHDGKPPQGFGLIFKGRLVCFYDYECDLGNGWEDKGIYDDSPDKRLQSLQMGANIIQYVFNN
ncbi:MAG: DUF4159 domain-containing protein [Bacteroidia bacterium]|nr:DUF4159 domain-containing protein [Bacteroidia bacterium]